MRNDRSSCLGSVQSEKWLRCCASLLLAGALLGTTGCAGDEKPSEQPQLSPMAEKGLTLAPFELDVAGLTLAETERIGLGSYYVNAIARCQDCHQTLSAGELPPYLGGGRAFPLSAAGGVVYSRNLTPDPGTGMKLSEAQFVESMRTGKDYKSEGGVEQLMAMPWATFRWMTEEDLKSIYAYLRKVPAINNPVPAGSKGTAAEARPVPFPSSYVDGEVARPLPAEDASDVLNTERGLALHPLEEPQGFASLSSRDRAMYARGSYLVNAVADCNRCHTNPARSLEPGAVPAKISTAQFLTGGQVFAVPPDVAAQTRNTRSMASNLLGATHGAMAELDYKEFRTMMVTGEVEIASGPAIRKLAYPMSGIAAGLREATGDDLLAIYTYLKNQTPKTGGADKATQHPARGCTEDTHCNQAANETCNTATQECVGSACSRNEECGACQTCASNNKCMAPELASACLTAGL